MTVTVTGSLPPKRGDGLDVFVADFEGVSSTKTLGTDCVETRKEQGEAEPSGPLSAASSGAGGRTGSSIRKESLRGVRSPTGIS